MLKMQLFMLLIKGQHHHHHDHAVWMESMATFILIHMEDHLLQICPEGWALWSGFCYLVGEGELSWGNAKAWCRDNNTNAKLVSIHSPMENDHVWQLLNELSGGRGWMGYSDATNPDHWIWEDGQNQLTYTRWVDPFHISTVQKC